MNEWVSKVPAGSSSETWCISSGGGSPPGPAGGGTTLRHAGRC